MRSLSFAIRLLSLCFLSKALPASHGSGSVPSSVTTVAQFKNGTWIESIAIKRHNTAILVTLLQPTAQIYQVSPLSLHPPILLAAIPHTASALGISEISPDLYAIIGNNFTVESGPSGPGTNSIWQLDVRGLPHAGGLTAQQAKKHTRLTEILDGPQASFLNGLSAIPSNPGAFLASESALGSIFRVDTNTKPSEIVQDDDVFKVRPGTTGGLGINGLSVRGEEMFWTNYDRQQLGRVLIDGTGRAGSTYQIVAQATEPVDDLAIARSGSEELFAVTNPGNSIIRVRRNEVANVVGGGAQSIVAGGTSAKFARGREGERGVLYVVTNGGALSPVDGGRVGAKVLKLDVKDWL